MPNLQGFLSAFFLKSFNNGAKGGSDMNSHGSRTSEPQIHMERTNVLPIKQIKDLSAPFFFFFKYGTNMNPEIKICDEKGV